MVQKPRPHRRYLSRPFWVLVGDSMKKYIVIYWDAGDQLVTRTVWANNSDEAIEMLANDPQNPLAQVKEIELVLE